MVPPLDEDNYYETDEILIIHHYSTPLESVSRIHIEQLSEVADIEQKENLEENLYKYESKDKKYVPLPDDMEYYDLAEEEFHDIPEEMIVPPTFDIFEGLSRLIEHPFLLCDIHMNTRFELYDNTNPEVSPETVRQSDDEIEPEQVYETPYDLADEYPDAVEHILQEHPNRYEILTISDVNKRQTKDALYPIFATFVKELAELIELEYPDSESLSSAIDGVALKNWQENKGTKTEVHISEFLGLGDITDLISNSNKLLATCGFESSGECREKMSDIKEYRNRVMHANKSLIHDKEELSQLIQVIDNMDNIITEVQDIE